MKIRIALVLAATAHACGPANVKQFLGNWNSVGSELIGGSPGPDGYLCRSEPITNSLDGNVTIEEGPTPGQVTTHTANGCHLNWAVEGKKASLINPSHPGERWQGVCYGGGEICPQFCNDRGVDATLDSGSLVLNVNVINYSVQGSWGGRRYQMVRECSLAWSGMYMRN